MLVCEWGDCSWPTPFLAVQHLIKHRVPLPADTKSNQQGIHLIEPVCPPIFSVTWLLRF